jgi:feruloyl-CoA synthase
MSPPAAPLYPVPVKSAPFKQTYFPSAEMQLERRADGTMVITPITPLDAFHPNIPAELARQAAALDQKPYLAQRSPRGGPWQLHSYAAMKHDADAIAQWLLNQKIAPGRSVLILSGNSIAHAAMKYGAMSARMPVCPVSVNYALMGGDYGRLRHVIGLIRPAVVFAEQAALFKSALERVDFAGAVVITDDPSQLQRPALALSAVMATTVTTAVEQSIGAIDPDAASIYMLTSGSTSLPKAVIQTQRMLASNIAQASQVLGRTAGWRDVMLDWLPWSHVSGAFTKMGVLTSGGTLYIDAGRPIPGQFDESIANIKELAPAFYVNVPLGYTMLADALERDAELRRRFFGGVRLALYGGAGLPQALYDRLQNMAVATVGQRIFFTTGYGATETTSGCMAIYFPSEEVGIGLPMPGLTLKLVPDGERYEVRLRGPMITPGYVGNPQANKDIFDDEGFYRTGDAAQFHDPANVGRGLKFAGRMAEDFKLASGTWVSAGRLRALLLEACAPLLADLLICGELRNYLAVLAWRSSAGRELGESLAMLLAERLASFNAARGASERIERLCLLDDPPSVDAHEVSDKGTINQRVALARRAADVDCLYAAAPDKHVVLPQSIPTNGA